MNAYHIPPAMDRAPPPHRHTMYQASSSHSMPSSFPILVVAVAGIVATAFLLVCYYIFVIKCCFNSQRFRLFSRFSGSASRLRLDPLVNNHATAAPPNRGLEQSVIQAIPIFRLRKTGQGKEKVMMSECAVCLCDFYDDEMLRFLPNCNHAFHIDCIDIWLQCNANCPICRSSIAVDPTVIPPSNLHDPYTQASTDTGRDLVIEIDDLQLNQQIESSSITARAAQGPSPKKLKQSKKQRRSSEQMSSKGDECIEVRRRVEEEFQVQPMRRSFSLDSSGDSQLYLHIRETVQQNPRLVDGSSDGVCSTSRSGRSFFSFGRASRNAILPLHTLD